MKDAMKVISVVGARPQFIKAAALSVALSKRDGIDERLLHTGQHYDQGLSQIFFTQMGIPRPSWDLGVGSGSHAAQTGAILTGVEDVLILNPVDLVLVYGDTNSTLAAALAAAKLNVKVAHVEAGMRSFNRRMPEEVNRVVCDHLADLHFCASDTAADNLAAEGVTEGVHRVGDIMADCYRIFSKSARDHVDLTARFGVKRDQFAVLTCHRAANTDDPALLAEIVSGVSAVSESVPVLFPVHPRVAGALDRAGLTFGKGVKMLEPVGYLEMLVLQEAAALVMTDSGGVQKEALYAHTPCITLRNETEWIETLETGWNVLVGADGLRIREAALGLLARTGDGPPYPEGLYGDGDTAGRIADVLEKDPGCA